jgi:hypothetical protein
MTSPTADAATSGYSLAQESAASAELQKQNFDLKMQVYVQAVQG